jgi:hypothetical protein
MAKRKKRYSKLTPKQRAIKRRAIEVAAFVLYLRMQEQQIKEGTSSYKKFLNVRIQQQQRAEGRRPHRKLILPPDVTWWEWYANEMALPKGSIMRQAEDKFGENERQIRRYIKRVEREGWTDAVVAKLLGDDPLGGSVNGENDWSRYGAASSTPEHFMTPSRR